MKEQQEPIKEIKDYLHLYLGCDVVVHDEDLKKRLVRTFFGFADPSKTSVYIYDRLAREGKTMVCFIKLLLRPLSDMKGDELQECGNMVYDFSDDPELNNYRWEDFQIGLAPEQFQWLLQKHFDLFGLIEAGLAIDATKVERTSE